MPDDLPDPTRTDQRPNDLPREEPAAIADDRGPLEPGALTASAPGPGDSTGGMVAGSGPDRYPREFEADLWGAAGADDIHEGLGDAADLSPDDAARVLFGKDAQAIRSAARDDDENDDAGPTGRRPER